MEETQFATVVWMVVAGLFAKVKRPGDNVYGVVTEHDLN